jgi:hypothetical protein
MNQKNNEIQTKISNQPTKYDLERELFYVLLNTHISNSSFEVNFSPPLYGTFFNLYPKNELNLYYSRKSFFSGPIENIVTGKEEWFGTQDNPNSWIQFSFKTKSIIPFAYMIRATNENYYYLQNWKLEGEQLVGGIWIELDSHTNDPFTKLQIRTFPIKCYEKIKSFKLTQTGTNTSNGSNYFDITAFDVFGQIYQ